MAAVQRARAQHEVRAAGGDVVPSFGGYAADDTGTEIADEAQNVLRVRFKEPV